MTYTANVKWLCKCGSENTDQLWTTVSDHCGEEYKNSEIPSDCDLNFTEPCPNCLKYILDEPYKENSKGEREFTIIRITA